MKFKQINILNLIGDFDAVCVTTNGVVKRNGDLVMGAGVAKQFANVFRGMPSILGDKVQTNGNHVYVACEYKGTTILSFPTKHNYSDLSDLNLIIASAKRLVKWADNTGATSIAIPSPGTGLGGLNKDVVYNELSNILDDRFYIVTK